MQDRLPAEPGQAWSLYAGHSRGPSALRQRQEPHRCQGKVRPHGLLRRYLTIMPRGFEGTSLRSSAAKSVQPLPERQCQGGQGATTPSPERTEAMFFSGQWRSLRAWKKAIARAIRRRVPSKPERLRPHLESLEERTVPDATPVLSAFDFFKSPAGEIFISTIAAQSQLGPVTERDADRGLLVCADVHRFHRADEHAGDDSWPSRPCWPRRSDRCQGRSRGHGRTRPDRSPGSNGAPGSDWAARRDWRQRRTGRHRAPRGDGATRGDRQRRAPGTARPARHARRTRFRGTARAAGANRRDRSHRAARVSRHQRHPRTAGTSGPTRPAGRYRPAGAAGLAGLQRHSGATGATRCYRSHRPARCYRANRPARRARRDRSSIGHTRAAIVWATFATPSSPPGLRNHAAPEAFLLCS